MDKGNINFGAAVVPKHDYTSKVFMKRIKPIIKDLAGDDFVFQVHDKVVLPTSGKKTPISAIQIKAKKIGSKMKSGYSDKILSWPAFRNNEHFSKHAKNVALEALEKAGFVTQKNKSKVEKYRIL